MRNRVYYLFILLILSSCARQYDYVPVPVDDYYTGENDVIYEEDVYTADFRDSVYNEDFEIYLTYIGLGSQYYIFECTFVNLSDYPIAVHKDDFIMDVIPGRAVRPLSSNDLAFELRNFKRELKKEKKNRTIWNTVLTGLEFVAAATAGAPIGENLLFTAEPIAYIFQDRSQIQRDIESVEDEIEYIHQMSLEEEFIAPGEFITKDLLFQPQIISSEAKIIYTKDRQEHICHFKDTIFRTRSN